MKIRTRIFQGACLLAFGASAAPAKPPPSDISARIDLYDAKSGKIYLVVYHAQMIPEPGGAVRFVKPRAVVLAREGKTLDEMIENPVAEITGAAGLYDPARQTLRVDEAHSTFYMGLAPERNGSDREGEAKKTPSVTVSSKRLDVFPEESRAVYEEGVRLVREDLTLLCDRLSARWDPETKKLRAAEAEGRPAVGTRRNGERLEASRIEVDLVRGKAVIPEGTGGRASFLAPGIFREGGEGR